MVKELEFGDPYFFPEKSLLHLSPCLECPSDPRKLI